MFTRFPMRPLAGLGLALPALLMTAAVAVPLRSAAAETLPAQPASDWSRPASPADAALGFSLPAEPWQPRMSTTAADEFEIVPLIIPWTFFAVTASDPPFASELHGGPLGEIGIEFGTPLYHVGGFHPLLTLAPAIGGQLYDDIGTHRGAFHFALNSLAGFALANPSGTNILQFGVMLRGEIAFNRLRYASGHDILGIDGLGAFSIGPFIRYSFLMDWDLAGSAALFVTADVTGGQRKWMIGLDFGGLIIAAVLALMSD